MNFLTILCASVVIITVDATAYEDYEDFSSVIGENNMKTSMLQIHDELLELYNRSENLLERVLHLQNSGRSRFPKKSKGKKLKHRNHNAVQSDLNPIYDKYVTFCEDRSEFTEVDKCMVCYCSRARAYKCEFVGHPRPHHCYFKRKGDESDIKLDTKKGEVFRSRRGWLICRGRCTRKSICMRMIRNVTCPSEERKKRDKILLDNFLSNIGRQLTKEEIEANKDPGDQNNNNKKENNGNNNKGENNGKNPKEGNNGNNNKGENNGNNNNGKNNGKNPKDGNNGNNNKGENNGNNSDGKNNGKNPKDGNNGNNNKGANNGKNPKDGNNGNNNNGENYGKNPKEGNNGNNNKGENNGHNNNGGSSEENLNCQWIGLFPNGYKYNAWVYSHCAVTAAPDIPTNKAQWVIKVRTGAYVYVPGRMAAIQGNLEDMAAYVAYQGREGRVISEYSFILCCPDQRYIHWIKGSIGEPPQCPGDLPVVHLNGKAMYFARAYHIDAGTYLPGRVIPEDNEVTLTYNGKLIVNSHPYGYDVLCLYPPP